MFTLISNDKTLIVEGCYFGFFKCIIFKRLCLNKMYCFFKHFNVLTLLKDGIIDGTKMG
jgi:hypothetical protein